jgi:hypothetical protein
MMRSAAVSNQFQRNGVALPSQWVDHGAGAGHRYFEIGDRLALQGLAERMAAPVYAGSPGPNIMFLAVTVRTDWGHQTGT